MKIKLALLDPDRNYLSRIVSALNAKYTDKFEIYSFTDKDTALQTLDKARINVFVVSDFFDMDVSAIPRRCGFAYFVDSVGVDTYKDRRAICKFQRADLIYKQILSVYSDVAGNIAGLKLGEDTCKIIAFASPSGGVGSSSMAAACAVHCAAQGKKTLYLNLEKLGSSDAFFTADGRFDMSDVIFALKSKKTNLPIKLESCVKLDRSGVYFYSPPKIALDMTELGAEEAIRLISEARLSGSYDCIILDTDFGLDSDTLKLLRQTHSVIWVGDGSEISNIKTRRAYKALAAKELNEDLPLTNRLSFIYNKFSNKTGKTNGVREMKELGGAPRYEHASTQQVIGQLCRLSALDKIIGTAAPLPAQGRSGLR